MIALLAAAALAGEIDAIGLQARIKAERDRPTAVVFWATWCRPCVDEFPRIIALARQHPRISFLAVSIDDGDDREAVTRFVERQQPPFPVYVKGAGPDEAFINGVDREWSGVVPCFMIFDAKGRRAVMLEGETSPDRMEKALKGAETGRQAE